MIPVINKNLCSHLFLKQALDMLLTVWLFNLVTWYCLWCLYVLCTMSTPLLVLKLIGCAYYFYQHGSLFVIAYLIIS